MDRIHIRFKSFYVTTGQDRCRLGKTKEMKVECVWECGVTVSLPNLLRIGEENLCLSRNLEIKILLYQLRFPSSLKENNPDLDGRFFGLQLLPVDVVQISRSLARYSISLEITGSMFTVLRTRHVVSFLFHERGKRGWKRTRCWTLRTAAGRFPWPLNPPAIHFKRSELSRWCTLDKKARS